MWDQSVILKHLYLRILNKSLLEFNYSKKADFLANLSVENGDNVHSGNLQQYNFQNAWKQATLLLLYFSRKGN